MSAAKGLISPSAASPSFRPCHNSLKAPGILRIGITLRPTCRKSPVPRIKTSIAGPQTTLLTAPIMLLNASMDFLPRSLAYRWPDP